MKNITPKLIELVKQEAKNLRKHASSTELNKLNIACLMPTNRERCIYGQITGNCVSSRAIELIEKCAPRIYKAGNNEEGWISGCKLSGKPYNAPRYINEIIYFSPIEVFIYMATRDQNESLIRYLKGEIKTLRLQ